MADFEVHAVGTAERLRAVHPGGCAPPVMVGESESAELSRMTARALRAEGKLADLGRLLDDYRERGHPMPTYSQVLRVLQG
ncbi:MAG: hypothetical protein MUC68_00395 [Burkholderiaceae bacterium]|jgi:hypothetical protein|nr:hypothetical protein [Burkholderiaceae bacterium]